MKSGRSRVRATVPEDSFPEYPNRSRCGGAVVNGTTIQWARTAGEVHGHLAAIEQRYGVRPHLVLPNVRSVSRDPRANLALRWTATQEFFDTVARDLKLATAEIALLDVGGIGSYAAAVRRHTCINIVRGAPPGQACTLYHGGGDPLPYSNSSFDVVLAESTLHHAAFDAPPLVGEMARVANSHVIIVEDLYEPSTSDDVARTYYRHDRHAIYRPLGAWVALAAAHSLRLRAVAVLHRVPIHVQASTPHAAERAQRVHVPHPPCLAGGDPYLTAYSLVSPGRHSPRAHALTPGQFWATRCELGYAPMAYLLFEKEAQARAPPVTVRQVVADFDQATSPWHEHDTARPMPPADVRAAPCARCSLGGQSRRNEERAAGFTCSCTKRRCLPCGDLKQLAKQLANHQRLRPRPEVATPPGKFKLLGPEPLKSAGRWHKAPVPRG